MPEDENVFSILEQNHRKVEHFAQISDRSEMTKEELAEALAKR